MSEARDKMVDTISVTLQRCGLEIIDSIEEAIKITDAILDAVKPEHVDSNRLADLYEAARQHNSRLADERDKLTADREACVEALRNIYEYTGSGPLTWREIANKTLRQIGEQP